MRISDGGAFEVVSVDSGPGIADLPASMQDGHSTAGSSGTGLGAIMRSASSFDVFSQQGKGTVLVARIGPRSDKGVFGVMQAAVAGESVCGDGFASAVLPNGVALHMVVDGLGHGPLANLASRTAVDVVQRHADSPPVELLERCHNALRSSRGAALAIARVDPGARRVRYAGIGNIAGCVVHGGQVRQMVSHNGTAGHQVRRLQEFEYDWLPGAVLLMHSDGLTSHWNLHHYPGFLTRDPSVIAGLLYRDYKRGRDDVTVLAWKEQSRT